MDFGHFLLFTQRIRKEEFHHLWKRQNPRIYDSHWPHDCADYFKTHLDDISYEDLDSIRVAPFGEILKTDREKFSIELRESIFAERFHANCSDPKVLSDLVDRWLGEWHDWHLNNLEPICNYSLCTRIGQQLYTCQFEKKLVAEYVAENFVRDGDQVAIPEGSSAFYVGMAIAKLRKNVSIITSNDPLIRETRDNPSVAKKFHRVLTISGYVDFIPDAVAGHGGVFGDHFQKQFIRAVLDKPKASLAILPVYKLLKSDGPIDNDASTADYKSKIVKAALDHDIRQIVFVADHTKHALGSGETRGIPQFATAKQWEQLVSSNKKRIAIVTCPPDRLRRKMQKGSIGRPNHRTESDLHEDERSYHRVSHHFCAMLDENFAEALEKENASLTDTPAPTVPPRKS